MLGQIIKKMVWIWCYISISKCLLQHLTYVFESYRY